MTALVGGEGRGGGVGIGDHAVAGAAEAGHAHAVAGQVEGAAVDGQGAPSAQGPRVAQLQDAAG